MGRSILPNVECAGYGCGPIFIVRGPGGSDVRADEICPITGSPLLACPWKNGKSF